jgi:Ca-activated chloride channel homolog
MVTRTRILGATCALLWCLSAKAQVDLKVDVNLVVLHVTVEDHRGKIVGSLGEEAFHIYENGVLQDISLFRREDSPVAVGLVVDNSGSMRRKLPDVVAAALAFANSSNPEDQMFIVNFNEHVSFGLPAGSPFTSDPSELHSAMLRIRAQGQTALHDAIYDALGHLRDSSLPKKVLIVVSDGGDNASKHKLPDVLEAIKRSDVIVYTVGLFDEYDKDRNPGVLSQLAKASGGVAYFPKEVREAATVLQAVSRDIRNQYTIGYSPKDERHDGTYRSIRVEVAAPHSARLIARTRPGYFAEPVNTPHTGDARVNEP